MARYTEAKYKLCRSYGEKLFLKGAKCNTAKCAVARRAYRPGQHGKRRRKDTDYGIQLREKQKAKRIYGVLERQFEKYFTLAASHNRFLFFSSSRAARACMASWLQNTWRCCILPL